MNTLLLKAIRGLGVSICLALVLIGCTSKQSAAITLSDSGWNSFTNANYVADMVLDHDNNLWVAGSGGVVRWNLLNSVHQVHNQ